MYGPVANGDPDEPWSPGGESLRSFDRRVRAALDRLVESRASDSVAIVTHGCGIPPHFSVTNSTSRACHAPGKRL